MKHVTIIVPRGSAHMSSIAGSYEILTRANQYWQKMGNDPLLEIQVAGYGPDRKQGAGIFSVNPLDIQDIKITDLIIIPSLSHEYETVINNNKELIVWIRDQYKIGAEIASICTGAFLLAETGLLEGKSCSTHWNAATDFRRLFPNIHLQTDKLITGHREFIPMAAHTLF